PCSPGVCRRFRGSRDHSPADKLTGNSALRFLADESTDFAVVRALRAAGHDVLAVSELMPGSNDREVVSEATRQQRVLLTEDKDFGWLVFVSQAESAGVVLIRFPGDARDTLARTVVQLAESHGEALTGSFVVVQPGHVRVSRRPTLEG
ncbi:MAG: DUF5615 family PIN-like protein, partial [Dehalococcoidia bacterium]|nr:DUF5615 family PIN-like protein [Dehalococcoidia bacterium]